MVEDAYKTKLLIGKFPVFVLNLAVEPAQVDVNVHPAKLEVALRMTMRYMNFSTTRLRRHCRKRC